LERSVNGRSSLQMLDDGRALSSLWCMEEKIVENVMVYNISVEDDESYTVAGVVTHNCRVPWDRCEICENLATSPKGPCNKAANIPSPGYCEHARYHLGQIMENGKRAAVHNDDPDFFDQSRVKNEAEILAQTLGFRKAASSGLYVPYEQSGAGMAEQAGLWVPQYKKASFPGTYLAKLALAMKLAEMDKVVPTDIVGIVAPRKDPSSDSKIKQVVQSDGLSTDQVLKAARAESILLDLSTFASIMNVGNEVVKMAMPHLPLLFSYLASQDLLNDTANNGTFDNPSGYVGTKLASVMKSLAPEMSLADEHCRRRLVEKDACEIHTKFGDKSPITEESDSLLRNYAAYCLSELAEIPHQKIASSLQLVLTGLKIQLN
jgi:hypothetical protein